MSDKGNAVRLLIKQTVMVFTNLLKKILTEFSYNDIKSSSHVLSFKLSLFGE